MCRQNELDFLDIKFDKKGVFSSLKSEIDLMDGADFCGWLESIDLEAKGCNEVKNGFLKIPSNEMIGIIL